MFPIITVTSGSCGGTLSLFTGISSPDVSHVGVINNFIECHINQTSCNIESLNVTTLKLGHHGNWTQVGSQLMTSVLVSCCSMFANFSHGMVLIKY